MLIGEYKHTLDPKKRLSMPSKWRKELGKKLVVTRGLDNCLFVYPLKEWKKITEKIGQLPLGQADTRSFNRFFLSGAVEVEVDSVGRILVPDYLKDFGQLDSKVVLAGIYNRVEIGMRHDGRPISAVSKSRPMRWPKSLEKLASYNLKPQKK